MRGSFTGATILAFAPEAELRARVLAPYGIDSDGNSGQAMPWLRGEWEWTPLRT